LKAHVQNTVPVTGTFFQGTQPVSLAAIPTVTEKQDQPAGTTVTWTSATALNTALTNNSVAGYGTANVSIQVPSTVTGGVITLEVSDDGTVWYQAGSVRVDNGQQENVVILAQSPGQALNRMYSISVDAMTNIRARLSTAITGTGNVVVRITLVAGGIEPFVAVRSRLVPTYGAAYRVAVAASNLWLGPTFVANTDKQLATIYHAATATKIVRIRFFSITLEAAGGSAGTFGFELRQLSATTAPATGAPAIIPRSFDSSDAAAEVTCLALPGTAGSDAAVNSPVSNHFVWSAAIGAAVADPSRAGQEIVLHNSRDAFDRKPLTMRAGVAEGFALIGRCSAATSLNYTAYVEFTEEPA
jgi:hypothetical protein